MIFLLNLLLKSRITAAMKKFLLTLLVILFAYTTAFYTSGAYEKQDLFDFGNSLMMYKIKCAISGETDTTDAFAVYSRAGNYMDMEEYEYAIQDYIKAMQIDPYMDYAKSDLAKAYLLNGDTAKSIASYKAFIASTEYPEDACTELGNIYKNLGNIDSTIFYYNMAVDKSTDNHLACFNLASLYFEKNDLENALENINKAIDIYQYDLSYRNLRRKIYLKTDQLNLAIAEYQFILSQDSNYFGNYKEQAKSAEKDGDFQKAIEFYKLALETQVDDKDLLQARGWLYHKTFAYDSALADFKKAALLYPDYSSYFNVAYTLDVLDSIKESIKYYDKSIKLKDDYYIAYNNRGYEYYRLGKFKDAEQDYSKSIKIKDDYYLSYYNRGALYFEQKKYKKALDDYLNAKKYIENDKNITYDIALTYDKLKNAEEAIYNYNEFLKISNGSDSAKVNYAIERVAELNKK